MTAGKRATGYDTIITGGLYFDGTGAPASIKNIAIKDGKISQVTTDELSLEGNPKVIEALTNLTLPSGVTIDVKMV